MIAQEKTSYSELKEEYSLKIKREKMLQKCERGKKAVSRKD